ncbi:hypothetical protein ACSBR2_042572 [Camellia fascicularis]
MSEGSSLLVEKPDNVLISSNGVFSVGFYYVGFNAYCFAIWYREPLYDRSHTTVWMANRDQPINGRLSKLTLHKNGNLILTDAGQLNVWATNTESISSVQLLLNDTGFNSLAKFSITNRYPSSLATTHQKHKARVISKPNQLFFWFLQALF